MSYYMFNAAFTANTYTPTGTTPTSTATNSYNIGDVADATPTLDPNGNTYLVTSDGFDITNANTTAVDLNPSSGMNSATGATGMGMGMHHHHQGGGMGQGQQNAEGKTFCTPCRMNAIKRFMKKQYIYAGVLGAILIIGILLYIIKKEPIIHPVLFGIIMGIAALLLLQVGRGIHQLHKMKNSLVVIGHNQNQNNNQ